MAFFTTAVSMDTPSSATAPDFQSAFTLVMPGRPPSSICSSFSHDGQCMPFTLNDIFAMVSTFPEFVGAPQRFKAAYSRMELPPCGPQSMPEQQRLINIPLKLVSLVKQVKNMDFAGNKTLIGVIAILLLLIASAVFVYNRTLNDLAAGSCTEDASVCPHAKIVDTQNLVIAALILVIAIMAGWLGYGAYFAKSDEGKVESVGKSSPAKKRKIAGNDLDSDESRVVAIINEGDGSAYQSDILKKTGFSKVKVSRLLDRLEQKGLVQRLRRGMTNLVVAK